MLIRLLKIKEINVQKTSLLYLSSIKSSFNTNTETHRRKIYYYDTFCLTIPISDIQLKDIDILTTSYAQSYFSSSIFKIEWFILHRLFRFTPKSFNDSNILKIKFLPGDEIVPGVFKVNKRTSEEILNDWNLFNNGLEGQNWLSVNIDLNKQKVNFLTGTIIYGNKKHWILLEIHKLYSKILLNIAVGKLLIHKK